MGVTFILFSISIVLFLGTLYYLLAAQKSGVYPPRQVLRKRAGVLAGGGVFFLTLGIIFQLFS
ncbi:hypothetical protein [Bacillus aquiflavi]|uniref:hypothetical protein n=1 Tax=Bacillus aquiflavi TaxID=2672567 RepID=UPI001FE907EC|nr:hypothetical protein [Bacillus aquiflavi]